VPNATGYCDVDLKTAALRGAPHGQSTTVSDLLALVGNAVTSRLSPRATPAQFPPELTPLPWGPSGREECGSSAAWNQPFHPV